MGLPGSATVRYTRTVPSPHFVHVRPWHTLPCPRCQHFLSTDCSVRPNFGPTDPTFLCLAVVFPLSSLYPSAFRPLDTNFITNLGSVFSTSFLVSFFNPACPHAALPVKHGLSPPNLPSARPYVMYPFMALIHSVDPIRDCILIQSRLESPLAFPLTRHTTYSYQLVCN